MIKDALILFFRKVPKTGGEQVKRKTLTVKEVAGYLGVHPDTIYAMVKHQEIPDVKLRNRILFTKHSIDAWVKEQENKIYKHKGGKKMNYLKN